MRRRGRRSLAAATCCWAGMSLSVPLNPLSWRHRALTSPDGRANQLARHLIVSLTRRSSVRVLLAIGASWGCHAESKTCIGRYIAAMRRAKFSAGSVTYVASALLTYEGGPAELQQVQACPVLAAPDNTGQCACRGSSVRGMLKSCCHCARRHRFLGRTVENISNISNTLRSPPSSRRNAQEPRPFCGDSAANRPCAVTPGGHEPNGTGPHEGGAPEGELLDKGDHRSQPVTAPPRCHRSFSQDCWLRSGPRPQCRSAKPCSGRL